jgi:HMG (high mobility group) box
MRVSMIVAAPTAAGDAISLLQVARLCVQAMSAFMFFSNANREKVKADNPGIAFGEVGRKLGELWRAATPEDKKEYEEQAAADKVEPADYPEYPVQSTNIEKI